MIAGSYAHGVEGLGIVPVAPDPEPPFVPLNDWEEGELLDELKVWIHVVLSCLFSFVF